MKDIRDTLLNMRKVQCWAVHVTAYCVTFYGKGEITTQTCLYVIKKFCKDSKKLRKVVRYGGGVNGAAEGNDGTEIFPPNIL